VPYEGLSFFSGAKQISGAGKKGGRRKKEEGTRKKEERRRERCRVQVERSEF
jgi:hypothetical protein